MTLAMTADSRDGRPALRNLIKVESIDADGLRSTDRMGMSELYWMVQVAGKGRPPIVVEDRVAQELEGPQVAS